MTRAKTTKDEDVSQDDAREAEDLLSSAGATLDEPTAPEDAEVAALVSEVEPDLIPPEPQVDADEPELVAEAADEEVPPEPEVTAEESGQAWLPEEDEAPDDVTSALADAERELESLTSDVTSAAGDADAFPEPSPAEDLFAHEAPDFADRLAEAMPISADSPWEVEQAPEAMTARSMPGVKDIKSAPSVAGLREEVEQIKGTILSALQRAEALLDRVDHTHEAARATYQQALEFRQRSQRACEAGNRLADAQGKAAEARAAHEAARERVDEARRAWNALQQEAESAQRCAEAELSAGAAG